MPVISVQSEDLVRPVGGGSRFRFLDWAWALDFQISIRPDLHPAGRSTGTILSCDKIELCLILCLRMLVLECTLVP
jgi:hypothetical protein